MTTTDQPAFDFARLALFVATVLVGLSTGFFYTYEASVTLGLSETSDVAYVEVFQALNDTIRNPAFGLAFFGSIPAILIAAALLWRDAGRLVRVLLVAAPVLYLAGLFVTATGNVPLNRDLAEVTPVTPGSAVEARAAFEEDWNRLNLIRTFAIGASFAALAAVPLVPASVGTRAATGNVMQHNR